MWHFRVFLIWSLPASPLPSLPVLWADINVLAQALLPPSVVYLMLFCSCLGGFCIQHCCNYRVSWSFACFSLPGPCFELPETGIMHFVSQLFSSSLHHIRRWVTLLSLSPVTHHLFLLLLHSFSLWFTSVHAVYRAVWPFLEIGT